MANVTYTVQKGDTLSSIARKYGTTVNELMRLNPIITDRNYIKIGWELVISGTPATKTTNSTTSKPSNVHLGLVSNSQRELYVTWDWDKPNTDHYEVTWYYSWGVGVAVEEKHTVSGTAKGDTFTAPEHATHVSVYVKPVSKTYTSNGKEVSYWTASNSTKVTYWYKDNPPVTPGEPSVTITDYTLTATVTDLEDLNADSIEFHVYQDDGTLFSSGTVKIVTYQATYTCTIDPGHQYKVQCRAWRDGEACSEWSGYSGNQQTKPGASSGITTCRATSSTSVFLEWGAVSNATSYDIQYATKQEYLESNQASSVSCTSTSYTLAGLESGKEYFFRVRAVNSQGESAWSSITSIILGKKPGAPTTWSSTTTAISGEPLYLYWVHNSADSSKQVKAELELDINGSVRVETINNPTADDEEAEEKTSSYTFDTSGYPEGVTLKWRVRTCGITGEYGDWSIIRTIDIYGPPTLALNVFDNSGNYLEALTSFPFRIVGHAGPSTQEPIGYHISIVSNESYETVDQIGNEMYIREGTEVYSTHFDISEDLDTTLSANNVDLENNISYTIVVTVTMNSGLSTESKWNFTVAWADFVCEPNAEIGIDKNTYSAVIRPYCKDEDGALIENVTLGVYRRTAEGSFVEIGSGLINTDATYIVDPHPALDYARYRIVATDKSTGSVSYCDLAGYPVGGIAAILQWDEKWTNFHVDEEDITDEPTPYVGSMLMLPYNIDVSESPNKDVSTVEYIGRKHPVSYYGTQLGYTATWNMDVPKSDKETIYALRRLASWMGDVYVREPSGTGYWASVSVSMNINHCDLIVPVTLNITRVEGGV